MSIYFIIQAVTSKLFDSPPVNWDWCLAQPCPWVKSKLILRWLCLQDFLLLGSSNSFQLKSSAVASSSLGILLAWWLPYTFVNYLSLNNTEIILIFECASVSYFYLTDSPEKLTKIQIFETFSPSFINSPSYSFILQIFVCPMCQVLGKVL